MRIYVYKKIFRNKYKNNWNVDIFIIDKMIYKNLITYSTQVEDGEETLGKFYNQELLKIKKSFLLINMLSNYRIL